MMTMIDRRKLASAALIAFFCAPVASSAEPIADLLAVVRSADGRDLQDRAALSAVGSLQRLQSTQLIEVLDGFGGATPRGLNLLRALATDVSDNGDFQADALLAFFRDRSRDSAARYVAFQLLVQDDATRKSELLANAATDPSLPVRYLKIESLLEAASSQNDDQPSDAISTLRQIIANGRSPKQLERAAKMLKQMDVEVDLANELGMVRKWSVLGPFDNTGSEDFDTVYIAENRYLDTGNPVAGEEKGKHGAIQWQTVSSEEALGMVDLNEPLNNEKDAAAYAFATFGVGAADQGTAQVRLGCITANKVWVNGKLVVSNEVYHSGTRIDQYIGDCELLAGENTVLVKVMQNAQTEPWAQDWQFQFRFTKNDGSAIRVDLK